MMYGWGDQGWGAGAWVVMAFGMIVFWTVVVLLILMIVRHWGAGERTSPPASSPQDILKERLARGEITEEEFRTRMNVLKEHP